MTGCSDGGITILQSNCTIKGATEAPLEILVTYVRLLIAELNKL